jgi:hypothetical protein
VTPRLLAGLAAGACAALAGSIAARATGLPPTAVDSDRSFKLTLIENLSRPPGILVLGSSRSRLAEPGYLRMLTGRTGFNAGVTGGTAADAWVFARFAAARFPQRRRYLWFVDAGIATNGVNPQLARDPRARRYLTGGPAYDVGYRGPYIPVAATRAALAGLRSCLRTGCRARLPYNTDGSIAHPSSRPDAAARLRRAVKTMLAGIRAHPPKPAVTLNPKRFVWFERTIAWMNGRGERPVIVLNPIYPSVLALLRHYGYGVRRAALAYLLDLKRRLDFVVVDCADIRSWGGTASDWSDARHVTEPNMRRLLRYVVAHSDGALR